MFDTKSFIADHFVDANGVAGLLSKHGFEAPKVNTIAKWFYRGAVPTDWWPILFLVAQRESPEPLNLTKYVKGGDYDIFD